MIDSVVRIKESLLDALPALSTPRCDAGLFRLGQMLKEPYEAVGYYLAQHGNVSYNVLDGLLADNHRANLTKLIRDTAEAPMVVGYYFVTHDQLREVFNYCHYFIEI